MNQEEKKDYTKKKKHTQTSINEKEKKKKIQKTPDFIPKRSPLSPKATTKHQDPSLCVREPQHAL